MSQFFTSGGQSIGVSASASVLPMNTQRLISSGMNWLDLLAVQGTLKCLLQHHSSKVSILRHSAFFIFQLSHTYKTTGKIIALTRWTFVGKVMSLLFNMLSRLVIAFLLTTHYSSLLPTKYMARSFVERIKQTQSYMPEKEIETHSSTLAWKIPWREEPGRLQSMGSQRVRHD